MKLTSIERNAEAREHSEAYWKEALARPNGRPRAWLNMIFVDHGFFRAAYLNRHRVGREGWRAAQPFPHQIRRMGRDGIRTIVSLRGGFQFGSLPLEIEACGAAGIKFENFVMRSRDLPTREEIADLDAFLNRIEYPALWHCKSGADRAGIMSALYLILREGAGPDEALRQLSPWYGHVRQGPTGVLDIFLEAARRDLAADPMSFREWVETRYDREALIAGFRNARWGSILVNRILRRE